LPDGVPDTFHFTGWCPARQLEAPPITRGVAHLSDIPQFDAGEYDDRQVRNRGTPSQLSWPRFGGRPQSGRRYHQNVRRGLAELRYDAGDGAAGPDDPTGIYRCGKESEWLIVQQSNYPN
jgi:hypothetical protein